MQKWEYMVESIDELLQDGSYAAMLNHHGRDGWELVSATEVAFEAVSETRVIREKVFYFKRPILDD